MRWLDKNEWEALKAKNLHDELYKVFSTKWQHQIREDHLREKLNQVYIKRFGEDVYKKLIDVREWIQAHPQKAALMAYLADDDPYSL
ncbi:MAG: hypothetical protein EOM12_17810 [Verrucomicrobiae bacterium]|nr:hypothetical protein [Verrucomicrobiae bacterium]